jgi:DNA-binding beta-propeller fold protein YncE
MAHRIAAAFLVAVLCGISAAQNPPLKLERTIPLPGVEGRIDHLAADIEGGRLFVAALGNGSVEVVDVTRGQRTGEIKSLKEPQGVVYLPATRTLYVATGGDGMVRAYNSKTLLLAGFIELGDDADNLRFDAQRNRILAGYGDGAIASLSLDLKSKVEVPLPAHPESFQFAPDGSHLFVNLPHDESVAVVDLAKMAVTAKWTRLDALANFPMTVDSEHNRVFVACRNPAQLLAFDPKTGAVIDRMPTVGDADDLFFDETRGRIYAIGSEGFVDVVNSSGRKLESVAHIPTGSGARTGLLVPAWSKLIVAAPHRGDEPARLLVFDLP